MKKALYFLFIVVSLSACSGNNYENEIAEIKEMQQTLSAIKTSYDKIDIKKVEVATETYKTNMSQIKTYYSPDSIPKKVAGIIDFYKGIKKCNKKFQNTYATFNSNLNLVDNQLSTLLLDLENGAHHPDSVKKYLEAERNNLDVVREECGILVDNYTTIVSIHDSLSIKVQNILLESVE